PGLDEHAPAPLPDRLLPGGPPRGHDGARRDHRSRRRLEAARDPGRARLLRDRRHLAEVNPGAPTRAVAVLLLLALVAPVDPAARPARREKASRASRNAARTAAAATGRPDAALYHHPH